MTDEREDVQKKAFAKWINQRLLQGGHDPIKDLFLVGFEASISIRVLGFQSEAHRSYWTKVGINSDSSPLQDLRDGTKLLLLLEILCGRTLPREKGRLRVHHMNNVTRALQVLDSQSVKLVNISTNDIVDGNTKLTLGLIWSIILHWQAQEVLRANRVR